MSFLLISISGAFAEIPPQVSVAVFDGANPVIYTDKNGKPAGFFYDFLSYIFGKNDIKVDFIQGLSFQEAFLATAAGKIDIMPAMKYSNARAEFYDFNEEAFVVSWSQVFVTPDSDIKTVFDLKDKRVALMSSDQNGKHFIKLMHDFDIPFTPVFYNSLAEMSDDLFENYINALVAFNFYMKSNTRLKATEIVFSPERVLVAVKKGTNKDILNLIDRELSALKSDENSFYYKLIDKWLAAYRVPSWVYVTLAASAVAVFIILLFLFLLKTQVEIIKKKLIKSEEVYKAIFDRANDSIFLIKINTNLESASYADINKTACERFGYTRKEFLSMSPYNIAEEIEKSKILTLSKKIRNNGNAVFQSIFLTKEGEKIPVEINAQTLKINRERFVIAIIRDLSYREEFDNLLSAVEMKYRTIADYNYDWEFWQTPERKLIYCSPSCFRISGYTEKEFMEDSSLFGGIIYSEDSETWAKYKSPISPANIAENNIEFRIVKKDNSVIWVEYQCRKIFDKDGIFIGFRGSIRDINKRKKMEDSLQRKQKLESIGVLAGGVAHDFNNILAIIRGYAEIGQLESGFNDAIMQKFSTILQAANRGINLTGQILDFARDKPSETKPVNVTSIVDEVYNLIKPSFPRTIKIVLEKNIDANILADEGKLHQIFMNICTNSRLAMPDGGELVISIKKADSEKNMRLFAENPETDAVEICIKDTGCGMSEEVKEKIFDPFFTTREIGEGTGMGMSVVHGLVKQWGGQIFVESIPGKGTSIFMFFKISDAASENKEAEPAEKKVRTMSNIIVFDDEEMILYLIEKFLDREGHKVFPYADVVEGLEYFKENYSSIDLVITDMTMPDMSGDILAAEIKKIDSTVPVLLSSGHSSGPEDDLPDAIDRVIQKPFTGKELIEAVNSILRR